MPVLRTTVDGHDLAVVMITTDEMQRFVAAGGQPRRGGLIAADAYRAAGMPWPPDDAGFLGGAVVVADGGLDDAAIRKALKTARKWEPAV